MALLSKASLNTLDYVFGGAPFCDQMVANSLEGSLDVVHRGQPFSSFADYPPPSLLLTVDQVLTLDVIFAGRPFCDAEVASIQSRSLDYVFRGLPGVLTYPSAGDAVRVDMEIYIQIRGAVSRDLEFAHTVNVVAPSSAPASFNSTPDGVMSNLSWAAVSGATAYDIEYRFI